MKNLYGVIPIVISTFHEDGSLDLESQRNLVRHLLTHGAHGLALFGNASEGYALTQDDKDRILTVVLDEVGGRVPVVVSTGHTGTYPAMQLSQAAAAAGADALMVLPPYLLKPDSQGVYDYFAAISKAVEIPIMVQDAPLMTQVAMPSTLLARMSREIENVKYVKVEAPPTAAKVTELVSLAGNNVVAFGGLNGNFLIEELERGAMGTMPGSDLCGGFVRIWDLIQTRKPVEARLEFQKLLPMIRYQLQPGLGVSAMKINLVAEGVINCSAVRSPTRTVDQQGIEELARLRDLR